MADSDIGIISILAKIDFSQYDKDLERLGKKAEKINAVVPAGTGFARAGSSGAGKSGKSPEQLAAEEEFRVRTRLAKEERKRKAQEQKEAEKLAKEQQKLADQTAKVEEEADQAILDAAQKAAEEEFRVRSRMAKEAKKLADQQAEDAQKAAAAAAKLAAKQQSDAAKAAAKLAADQAKAAAKAAADQAKAAKKAADDLFKFQSAMARQKAKQDAADAAAAAKLADDLAKEQARAAKEAADAAQAAAEEEFRVRSHFAEEARKQAENDAKERKKIEELGDPGRSVSQSLGGGMLGIAGSMSGNPIAGIGMQIGADMFERGQQLKAVAAEGGAAAQAAGAAGTKMMALGAGAAVGGLAVGVAADQLAKLYSAGTEASMAMDRVKIAIGSVSGSSADGAKNLKMLVDLSDELGVNYRALAEGSTGIFAGAQGTTMEGQGARDLVEGFAKFGAAKQVDSRQMGLGAYALSQMAGSDVLQGDEIRQFTEAIPGGRQTIARAVGVGGSELKELGRDGKLLAEEVLPKLAQQMKAESALGLAKSVDSLSASFDRLDNAKFKALADIGKLTEPLTKAFNNALAGDLERFTFQLEQLFPQLRNNVDTLADLAEQSEKNARDLANSTGNAPKNPYEGIKPTDSLLTKIPAFAIGYGAVSAVGQAITGKTAAEMEAINMAKEKDRRAAEDQANFNRDVGGKVDIITKRSVEIGDEFQAAISSGAADGIGEIDKQIQDLRAQRNALTGADKQGAKADELDQRIKDLYSQREVQGEDIFKKSAAAGQQIETLENTLKDLEQRQKDGLLPSSEVGKIADVRNEMERLKDLQDQYNESLAASVRATEKLQKALKAADAVRIDNKFQLDKRAEATRLSVAVATRNETSESRDAINRGVERGINEASISANASAIQNYLKILSDPEITRTLGAIGVGDIDPATVDLEALKNTVEEKTKDKSSERKAGEAAISAIESIRDLQNESVNAAQQIAKANQETADRYRELSKAVEDFYREQNEQIQSAQSEVEKTTAQIGFTDVKTKFRNSMLGLHDTFSDGFVGSFIEAMEEINKITQEGIDAQQDIRDKQNQYAALQRQATDLNRQAAGVNEAGGVAAGTGGIVSGTDDRNTATLALISTLEAPTRAGRVDVATAVMNRVAATRIGEGNYGNDVVEVAFAPGQFEPFFGRNASEVTDLNSAAKILAEERGMSLEQALQELRQTLTDLGNAQMVTDSRRNVGGRTDFKGTTQYGNMVRGEDYLRQDGENFFHIGGGQTYAQLDRISAASAQMGMAQAKGVAPASAEARPSQAVAPVGGLQLRLMQTNENDENGLRRLVLQLIDSNGQVIDAVEANSGVASNQDFSREGSLYSTAGSLAPLPSGEYQIGAQEESSDNFGGQSGLGNWWVPIEGGDNQGGRGSFGIHIDGNRVNAPGSAGCIVLADESNRAQVEEWLDGANAPKTLIVDYDTPAQPVTTISQGLNQVRSGGNIDVSGQTAKVGSALTQARTQLDSDIAAIQQRQAAAERESTVRLAEIVDNAAEEQRKASEQMEDKAREDRRKVEDSQIALIPDDGIREMRQQMVEMQRANEDDLRERQRYVEKLQRTTEQVQKTKAQAEEQIASGNLTAAQKSTLQQLVAGYDDFLEKTKAATVTAQAEIATIEGTFQATVSRFVDEKLEEIREVTKNVAKNFVQLRDRLGLAAPAEKLRNEIADIRSTFADANTEIDNSIKLQEALLAAGGLTAQQEAAINAELATQRSIREQTNQVQEQAIGIATMRARQAELETIRNFNAQGTSSRVSLLNAQATRASANYQSGGINGAISLQRQAAELEERQRLVNNLADIEKQRLELINGQGFSAEAAESAVRPLIDDTMELNSLNLENINNQYKGLGETLRDTLADGISQGVESFSDVLFNSSGDILQDLSKWFLGAISSLGENLVKGELRKLSERINNDLFNQDDGELRTLGDPSPDDPNATYQAGGLTPNPAAAGMSAIETTPGLQALDGATSGFAIRLDQAGNLILQSAYGFTQTVAGGQLTPDATLDPAGFGEFGESAQVPELMEGLKVSAQNFNFLTQTQIQPDIPQPAVEPVDSFGLSSNIPELSGAVESAGQSLNFDMQAGADAAAGTLSAAGEITSQNILGGLQRSLPGILTAATAAISGKSGGVGAILGMLPQLVSIGASLFGGGGGGGAAASAGNTMAGGFAKGGVIGQGRSNRDDVHILAQRGEGILTHQGMANIGGAAGLHSMNWGGKYAFGGEVRRLGDRVGTKIKPPTRSGGGNSKVSFEYKNMGGVDYVDVGQLQQLEQRLRQELPGQGATLAYKGMRSSPAIRRGLGMR